MLPFAFLHYGPAMCFGWTLIAASFLLAAFLMWELGAELLACRRRLPGRVPGGEQRTAPLYRQSGRHCGKPFDCGGMVLYSRTVCLCRNALPGCQPGLQPHDAALIWLFFLLAGGTYRKPRCKRWRCFWSSLCRRCSGLPGCLRTGCRR